jgi:hypothetical protein
MAAIEVPNIDLKTAKALRKAFGYFYSDVDPEKTEALRKAFGYFGDLEKNAPDIKEPVDFKDPDTGIAFKTSADFRAELKKLGLPEGTPVKNIGIEVERWYETLQRGETTMAGAPEPENAANVPNAGLREAQKIEYEQRLAAKMAADENAKADVERMIKRYKDRTITVVPKDLQTLTLDPNQKMTIYRYAQAAASDPGITQEEVANIMRGAIPEELRDSIPEQAIQNTARGFVEKARGFAEYKTAEEIPTETTIMNPAGPPAALNDPNNKVFQEIIPEEEVRVALASDAQVISYAFAARYDTETTLTAPLFGGDTTLTWSFYGPPSTEFEPVKGENKNGIKLNLSVIHEAGSDVKEFVAKVPKLGVSGEGREVASTGIVPTRVPYQYTGDEALAKRAQGFLQKERFGRFRGFNTQGEYAKYVTRISKTSELSRDVPVTPGVMAGSTDGAVRILFTQMALKKAPLLLVPKVTEAIIKGGFQTTALASLATEGRVIYFAGLGKYSFNIVNLSGASSELYIAGLNFGNRAFGLGLAKTGGKVVATGIITKGATGQITTRALPALFSKVGSWLGSIAPIIGNILGAISGWIFGKVLDKIPWKKVKEWSAAILGTAAAIISLPFVGLAAALGIGGATTVISALFGGGLGGLTLGGVGASVGGFLGALILTTLGNIAGWLFVVFISFSLMVTLILFIINAGAYVVPQIPEVATGAVGRTGVNVVCSTDKGPVGVSGPTSSSPIANRAWEIVFDLYQGFWCFWNRSPSNVPWNGPPRPDFPNDIVKYPPNYPQPIYFDYNLYAVNKNPSEKSGPDLFWCTDLVIKAYQETGHNIPPDLGVAEMHAHWPVNKIIAAKDATPQNIVPGSAVFFRVTSGDFANQLNHVGIVYSVDLAGITVVESNNAVKSERITFTFTTAGSCTPLCLKNATFQECGCYGQVNGVANLPGMLVDSFGLPY